jgi:preprotein translocase subunit SecE
MAVAKEKEREQQENVVARTLRETRNELKKVVWPSREETTRLTIVVIAISVTIGLILFIGDSLFLFLYTQLVSLLS